MNILNILGQIVFFLFWASIGVIAFSFISAVHMFIKMLLDED